jgi:hypothetical protein
MIKVEWIFSLQDKNLPDRFCTYWKEMHGTEFKGLKHSTIKYPSNRFGHKAGLKNIFRNEWRLGVNRE